MHVKPQAANVSVRFCQISDVTKQSAEDALAAAFAFDIDTLEPPDVSVSPIAPFVGDHHLAGDGAIHLGHKVPPFGGVAQERDYPRANACRVKAQLFRFQRQPAIELGDGVGV